MKMNEYLTIQEAADFLGVSKPTLLLWERNKKLLPYRNPANKYRLYKKEDLQKYLDIINAPSLESGSGFDDSLELSSFDQCNEPIGIATSNRKNEK